MKVRFQADADLKHAIVRGILRREPMIDFQTATSAGLVSLDDLEVLTVAAREGRLLVTHDNRTMPGHFARFITKNTSPGVIVASQRLAIGIVVEELLLIWSASEADEWVNRIVHLPL
jgi:hypothetical protein